MNLKAPCLLSLFLLPCVACETERAASDAGTTRARQCTPVTLEHFNQTKAPVRVLAFYELTDGGKTTPHAVRQGEPLAPGATFRFTVPECVTPTTRVHVSVEAFGVSADQDATFTGALGPRVECIAVVSSSGLSHSCRAGD